jgi:hypothetical protein
MLAGYSPDYPAGRSKAEQESVMGRSKRYDPKVYYAGGDFKMDSKIDDAIGDTASGVHATADTVLTQDAFNQTITQGANIQFNSNTMSVAGPDLQDSHDLG